MSRRRVVQVAFAAALVAVLAYGIPALGAQPRRAAPARAKHGRPYSAKLTYQVTKQGTGTAPEQGKGTFSAKLSPRAAFEAALISLVTGVPVAKIAQGGSYKLERKFHANGTVTGLAVVKFKAHGLGTVCVSYTQHQGQFIQSQGFVQMLGTVKTVGGTGAAGKWHVKLSFKQTGISGLNIEHFTFTGSEHASIGTARKMTAACKHVAGLH